MARLGVVVPGGSAAVTKRPQPSADALVAALTALIDERVALVLANLGHGKGYSSASLPAGVTRRTFNSWCRTGRVRDAKRDGAGWTCSVEAWRSARATARMGAIQQEQDIDKLLANAGLRRTR